LKATEEKSRIWIRGSGENYLVIYTNWRVVLRKIKSLVTVGSTDLLHYVLQ
jgi:hypothetical protein